MVWGRICPDGHSTYPCESEEFKATLKMLSAARGSDVLQQMVVDYRPKKAAYLQQPPLPVLAWRPARMADWKATSPFTFRVLCVQGTDKLREPQRNV